DPRGNTRDTYQEGRVALHAQLVRNSSSTDSIPPKYSSFASYTAPAIWSVSSSFATHVAIIAFEVDVRSDGERTPWRVRRASCGYGVLRLRRAIRFAHGWAALRMT